MEDGGRREASRLPSENGHSMTCLSLPLALTSIESQIKCVRYNYKGSKYVFALNKFG